jgi:hypothetical protein
MPGSLPAGSMDFAIPNDSFKQITLMSSALVWPDAKFVLYSQSILLGLDVTDPRLTSL